MVAGGNLAASYSYGDITVGGVGTATSVCNNKVVGFGHPMDFLGETSLSLHPASALYIQPDSLGSPFKVANFATPAGTINEDHLTGITGAFGALPQGATVTSDVSYAGRNRVGSSTVTVPQAWARWPSTSSSPTTTGWSTPSARARRTRAGRSRAARAATPFTFTRSDRFTSSYDISYDASFELADLMYLLSTVEGVDVDSIAVDGDVTNECRDVRGVGQRAAGQGRSGRRSTTATRPRSGRARRLQLRVVLRGSDGTSATVPYSFKIPRRAAGNRGTIYLTGGNDYYSEDFFYDEFGGAKSLTDIANYIDGLVRNDQIAGQLFIGGGLPGGCEGEGEDVAVADGRGCKGTGEIQKDATLGPADKVVSGFKRLKIVVKGHRRRQH